MSCSTKSKDSESMRLYKDVFNQLTGEKYHRGCFDGMKGIDRIENEFASGKRSSNDFQKVDDSLMILRQNILPKCFIDYRQYFRSYSATDLKVLIPKALKDTFVSENFKRISLETILDTVSQSAILNERNLGNAIIDVVPHDKKELRPWGDGVGGPKNGVGDLLFMEFSKSKWIIIGRGWVWIS